MSNINSRGPISFPSNVARFACSTSCSRRFVDQEDIGIRPHRLDSDRIIHSTAFRRLMGKTQVFVAPVGDHVRTRLTHTLEVAFAARSIARELMLNEDLAEAVALAHDLGHPPFGHAGEDALNAMTLQAGGFEHNAQAIRIVTCLESGHIEFDGLNLTWDTLEGIAKHNGPILDSVPYAISEYNRHHDLELDSQPSAEAQVAAIADDITYICHDLQDGLTLTMLGMSQLEELPLVGKACSATGDMYPNAERSRLERASLRKLFAMMVEDVVRESRTRLEEADPKSVDDVRSESAPVIAFSESFATNLIPVREFLKQNLYRATKIVDECHKGADTIRFLFEHLFRNPCLLPESWQQMAVNCKDSAELTRLIADYISGMTENFALLQRDKICNRGFVEPEMGRR